MSATYCVAGKYARERPPRIVRESDISTESVSFSVQRHVELPEVPIEAPRIPFRVLKKIVAHEGEIDSIKTLASLLQGKSVSQSDIVKVSRHVETLEGFGYVRRQRKGRKVAIRVTEKGRNIVDLADAPSFTRT